MADFVVQIVDHVIEINTIYERTGNYCKKYISQRAPDFIVHTTLDDIYFEHQKAAQEGTLEGLNELNHADSQLEITALQRKITEEFFSRDILLFHGSVVAIDGQAYLFTAKSGTGKSTHTGLWREVFGERAVMVNDDKPFLQITEDGVIAWGSPWNGKHRLGSNIGVPLKAICILTRSQDNWIKPIGIKEALPMLFQQSQRPQNPANMEKYMELIDKLANGVELWKMGCNMDPEAAVIAYEAMSGKRKED